MGENIVLLQINKNNQISDISISFKFLKKTSYEPVKQSQSDIMERSWALAIDLPGI